MSGRKSGKGGKKRDNGEKRRISLRGGGRRKRLTVGLLMAVLFLMTAGAFFMQIEQQLAASCDLKVRKIEKSVAVEKSTQKKLRMELARLKSPGRVARIAQDEIGMGEPTGVIYLKYSRDRGGNIACESTFEKRAPVPVQVKPETTTAQAEPEQALSRR